MEWFASWFDSPYYHLLYSHRNHEEAALFIDHILKKLQLKEGDTILDLGCGKGRHSMYLASKGMNVVGMDLSPNSIKQAIDESNLIDYKYKPTFKVADMRDFEYEHKFMFVFNLFTSFGYFDNIEDNEQVIKQIYKHQDTGGVLLIDYFNSTKVKEKGEESYIKKFNNVEFKIHKFFEHNKVKKNITITSPTENLYFQESVQLFEKEQIEQLLIKVGYEIICHYGSYNLENYTENSDRSILIATKK